MSSWWEAEALGPPPSGASLVEACALPESMHAIHHTTEEARMARLA